MPRTQTTKTASAKASMKAPASKLAAKKGPVSAVAAKGAAKPVGCKTPATSKAACAPVAVRPMTSRAPVVADKTPRAPRTRPVAGRAIEHAIALLTGAGCQYEIFDRNGNRFSNLPEPVPGRQRVNSFVALGYATRVPAMKVGESIVFDLSKYSPSAQLSFQGAVSTLGSRTFGRGKFATSRQKDTVEVCRLG